MDVLSHYNRKIEWYYMNPFYKDDAEYQYFADLI